MTRDQEPIDRLTARADAAIEHAENMGLLARELKRFAEELCSEAQALLAAMRRRRPPPR
jgi:hypothetical protein